MNENAQKVYQVLLGEESIEGHSMEFFKMDRWGGQSCGTPCCLGGIASLIMWSIEIEMWWSMETETRVSRFPCAFSEATVADWLGIPIRIANHLFFPAGGTVPEALFPEGVFDPPDNPRHPLRWRGPEDAKLAAEALKRACDPAFQRRFREIH